MPCAWRIVPARRADEAFTGHGAKLYGGRWNSKGRSMVYVSQSRALAMLEILVHINPQPITALNYVAFSVEWEDRLTRWLDPADLPAEWREEPPGASTMRLGDQWARERLSAALAVPSAIIPEETNFLLNPDHPDFNLIRLGAARPFLLDNRLVRAEPR